MVCKAASENVDWFFHQTQFSFALAKSIGLLKSSVTGDTRFDRVKQLRERDNHVDHITDFIGKIKPLFSEVHGRQKRKLQK
jgi:3-deoxy-D-manno-octulosonic-acid transferase